MGLVSAPPLFPLSRHSHSPLIAFTQQVLLMGPLQFSSEVTSSSCHFLPHSQLHVFPWAAPSFIDYLSYR